MKNNISTNYICFAELLRQFLALEHSDNVSEMIKNSILHYKNGLMMYNLKQYNDALAELDLAIVTGENGAIIFYNKATILSDMTDYKEALRYYDKSIECNPNIAEVHYDKAILLNRLQQYNNAIDEYNKAIILNHNFVKAYYNKALVLHQLKEYQQAIKSYDECINRGFIGEDVHYNKGVALHAMQNFKLAIESYDKVIVIKPNLKVYQVKALAFCELKEFTAAIETYQNLIKVFPNDVQAKKNIQMIIQKLSTEEQVKYINLTQKKNELEYQQSQDKKKLNMTDGNEENINLLDSQLQYNFLSQNENSVFIASQSSKMEEESEEEEWQPSGVNQQNQQKLLAVHGSEFSLAILNHSEILKQFNHKHGSSNTSKLIGLCHELGNANLSELEELLYSKEDLPSSQVGDALLSDPAVQINLAPLELLMGLDGGNINEQL